MTAVKLRIQDLVEGTYDGKNVHTPFGEVSEARILGTLIDVFVTDDDSYLSLTVDDGTETVRIKAWRQDVEKLKKFSKGDIIDVVGKVREYNEEIYLTPEVVFKVSPNKWVLRELELMKLYIQSGAERLKPEKPPVDVREEEIEAEAAGFTTADEVEIQEQEKEQPQEKPTEPIEKEEKEKEEKEKEEKEVIEEKTDIEEIEEFEILGEDEVVETVLDLLQKQMTKEALIEQSGLDEIDVELALRELLDEGKITKEDNNYQRVDSR